MTEQEKQAEIERLKEEVIVLKEKIDTRLASGEVELSQDAMRRIMFASNEEYTFKTSDQILKEQGVPRALRRKLDHMKRRKPSETPAHTVRAQKVANRMAAARKVAA